MIAVVLLQINIENQLYSCNTSHTNTCIGATGCEQPFNIVNITSDIVFNKLKNLKSKLPEPDSIHPRVLKEAAAQLSDRVIVGAFMAGPVFGHAIFNFKSS